MAVEVDRPPGQAYLANGPAIPLEGMNFQPRHSVSLKDFGVFIPANNHHDFSEGGNITGHTNEQIVGLLLANIDFVRQVIQVEPFGEEDLKQIDLIVDMVDGYPIDRVFVQVKSGYTEVATFFDLIGRQLDEIDKNAGIPKQELTEFEEYRRRKDFMMRRGLICINAGRKKRGMVTDFYIRDKFMRDLEEMIAFRRNNP